MASVAGAAPVLKNSGTAAASQCLSHSPRWRLVILSGKLLGKLPGHPLNSRSSLTNTLESGNALLQCF